jgi:DNA topoisomerase I
VYVLIGPFGPYIQLGPVVEDGEKPKRVSIPKGTDSQSVSLEQATALLTLPREIGLHPETGKPVKAGIGRFGPYVFHEGTYKSLRKEHDVLTVDLVTAVELLKQARKRGAPAPLKELGAHPADGQPVQLFEGKYGPYVKHGKINATVPKETPIDQVTLQQAVQLLDARSGVEPRKAPKKRTSRPAPKPPKKSPDTPAKKPPKKPPKKPKKTKPE